MDLLLVENLQVTFVFAVLAISFYFYLTEKVSIDIVAGWVLLSLSIFFFIFPVLDENGINKLSITTLFQEFANPAIITIISLMIIGHTLGETGALDTIAKKLIKNKNLPVNFLFTFSLILIGWLSSFLNNVPIVIVFIPFIVAMATKLKSSPTKWLLPLSYITILGGMTTLVGSSTNLVVSGAVEQAGLQPLKFFSFTEMGLLLAGVGSIYVLFIIPNFMKNKKPLRSQINDGDDRKFFSNIKISTTSPLAGKTVNGTKIKGYSGDIISIVRGDTRFERPFENSVILPEDEILVLSDRDSLLSFASGDVENMGKISDCDEQVLAEVIVTNRSDRIGSTLRQMHMKKTYNVTPVGLERNSGMLQTDIMDIPLRTSDVLLVVGTKENIAELMEEHGLILIEASSEDVLHKHHIYRTIGIFVGTILLIATDIFPTAISALIGAMLMISSGCVSFTNAMKAIDRHIILLLASTLAIGIALQQTGGAKLISDCILYMLSGLQPAYILSIFFFVIMIMTNILSNQATAIIFTPIAISLANSIGVDVNAFIFAVIFAANCCFITPFAYQTNLLVTNPGQYNVKDFIKFGTPLAILIWLLYSFLAPSYFGF